MTWNCLNLALAALTAATLFGTGPAAAQTFNSGSSGADGAFNPVVCDDGTVYLTGYSKLYQLIPKRGQSASRAVPAAESPRKRAQSRSGRRRK